ncbi:TonB-dependent receptor [Lysobacter sp. M2-1]|uniref:TonB-dependent receptor n=1 Tax=Lysobacter sp. M2-1 TaxID=2916839 RepID=UPI001F5AF4C1|nr:TonB-dependent receptor [Lysobacter sp. M2-1]
MQLKRNLLSVALASATLMLAANAQAQDTSTDQATTATTADQEATELDAVVVTGIRRGIENAIDTKQSSDSIVEAISAEDIGKLPDVSIAESIARLPGLTAQRVAGRSSTINIRGLSENFGTALLNGREQVSVSYNRGVEFDQYPSELMSAVVVYKTPDASLIGQGLSGTVDLQTVRPLSFNERVMAFNVRGEQNSLGKLNPESDDTGYRVSGSYIDQFLDGRLGVAIGYARLDSPGQANRWESWGYPEYGANRDRVLGGFKSQVSSVDNVRDGLMATVEFKPNDFYHGILDLYYSTFEKEETLRFMETGLAWSSATLSNAVVENGAVVSGTFTGVRPVLRNDRNTQDDTIFAAGWRNEFEFNENWSAVADVSFSKAEREETILETYSGLGHASNPDAFDTVDFVIGGSGLPQFSYGEDYGDPANIVLTDPGGWGQDGFLKVPRVEDKLSSLRLSAERSFETGIFSSFEFGVNFADREKTRESGLEAFLRLRDGDEVAIPSGALLDPADLGFTGIPGSIGYDLDQIMGLYDVDQLIHQDVTNKNWTVEEKLTTGYVQWNINADWGSIPLRGNVGFQMVRADQSSSGYQVPFSEADNPIPLSGGAKYTDFLPSLNLAFSLPHDQTLRVGLGEQMARPRMDQMRANNNISINNDRGIWTASGGNPELEPWRATAFDLSYEKYFGGRGYFSLAGFHKDLHTWIRETTVPYDFGNPDCGTRPICPISSVGEFTRPENVNGGILYGFEAAVSVPFDLLWAPLEGFGIQASYSTTHSSVKPDPEEPAIDLPGLSKEVSNVTLYYERYGFSTRVSRRHRSPFLGEVTGFGNDRQDRYINHEDIVDFQIGYAFPEGSTLNGLSLLFQINNVTNEPYREYFPDFVSLPRMFNEYGRTALLGLTYKF